MARMSERPSGRPAPHSTPRRATRRERAIVLGGIALAVPVTVAALVLDADSAVIGLVRSTAVAWTAAASLAAPLGRGLADGDRSAFRDHELPEDDGDIDEGVSRTGRYRYLRDLERPIRDNDHLRDRGLS